MPAALVNSEPPGTPPRTREAPFSAALRASSQAASAVDIQELRCWSQGLVHSGLPTGEVEVGGTGEADKVEDSARAAGAVFGVGLIGGDRTSGLAAAHPAVRMENVAATAQRCREGREQTSIVHLNVPMDDTDGI